MKAATIRKRSRLLTPLLLILLALFYWEFFYDPRPSQAVAFFYPIDAVDDADNAIYSIAGLAAPLDSADPRQWGYRQTVANWQRVRDGENPKPVLSDWGMSKDYPRLSGLAAGKLFCWSPRALAENERDKCYREDELAAAVHDNRVLLRRYETLFDFGSLETRHFYGVNLSETIAYTNLYAFRFWLRRARLSADDEANIFRFYRFWKKMFEEAATGYSARMLIRINYGRASELLSRLAQSNPRILLAYRERHGDFEQAVDSQALLDFMYRREYALLDRFYCLRAHFGVADDCRPVGIRFPGKLGETAANLYAARPRLETCAREMNRANHRISRDDRWGFMLRDPGNVFGNFLQTTIASPGQLCLALRAYLVEAEVDRLRNLYFEFTDAGMSASQLNLRYRDDPVIFDNPFSGNRIAWNPENERLSLTNRRFHRQFFIPLQ